MRGLWKLILIQMKLYLREPVATFFTIFYAPMVLLLFGAIYGNEPTPLFGGRGTMDITVPSYIGLIVCGETNEGAMVWRGMGSALERGRGAGGVPADRRDHCGADVSVGVA